MLNVTSGGAAAYSPGLRLQALGSSLQAPLGSRRPCARRRFYGGSTPRRSSISTMIQAASAFSGDDLQCLKAERLRAEQAQAAAGEDLQWATAAMLTREELAEQLSALTAKASATPVTASIFYLDVEPSELLGYRGAADPGGST